MLTVILAYVVDALGIVLMYICVCLSHAQVVPLDGSHDVMSCCIVPLAYSCHYNESNWPQSVRDDEVVQCFQQLARGCRLRVKLFSRFTFHSS